VFVLLLSSSIVCGECTRKPPCSSSPIFTSCASASSAISFQYGTRRFSHCHSLISEYSCGHGVTGQFTEVSVSFPAGVPLNALTTGTPIMAASSIVFLSTSSDSFLNASSGEIGLPWQLNPLIESPRFSNSDKYSLRASSEPSSLSTLQWALPG